MDFLLNVILPSILIYKYFAIFLITLLAALALPVPPGAFLMTSAALASQGYFSFFWVVFIGSLGNIIGDNIGYFLAKKYGKYVFYKMGLRKSIESDRYKRIEKRLIEHSGFVIFVTRFEVFSNLAVNIMCGISRLSYKKYLIFEVLGEVAQVLLYCSIGYVVGDNWKVINTLMNKSLVYTGLILVMFVLVIWYRSKMRDRI